MYKKELAVLIVAAILIIPILYNSDAIAKSISNNIGAAKISSVNQNYADSYDINIVHTNNSSGKYKTYKAASTPIDLYTAKTYGGLFGLTDFSEYEESYIYLNENKTESLTIYKDGSKLKYTSTSRKNNSDKKINEQQAKSISESFINDIMLPLNYNICEVSYSHSSRTYKVLFINTIEGIKNYAFPKTVEIDEFGNIIYVLYYNYVYKPISQVSVISESKAVDILLDTKPSETGLDGKIDIKSLELVYNVSVNGNIYPYYRFSGQMRGNKGYECFLPSFEEE